ncbi:hypothetical protein ACHAW6_008542, partial [Cyclotella cf. meneghiniana]
VTCLSDSTSSQITHLQTGLTKGIIEAVGLCSSLSTPINTPAETSPLPKDDNGNPASGSFNYAAVVSMLLYLSGHSRPDIAFAVHQFARYTFKPTRQHELSLVRIGRYLKGTMDKGLIMSLSPDPRVDCYPMLILLVFMDMKTCSTLIVPIVALAVSSLPLAALSYGFPAFKPKLLSPPWKQNMLI